MLISRVLWPLSLTETLNFQISERLRTVKWRVTGEDAQYPTLTSIHVCVHMSESTFKLQWNTQHTPYTQTGDSTSWWWRIVIENTTNICFNCLVLFFRKDTNYSSKAETKLEPVLWHFRSKHVTLSCLLFNGVSLFLSSFMMFSKWSKHYSCLKALCNLSMASGMTHSHKEDSLLPLSCNNSPGLLALSLCSLGFSWTADHISTKCQPLLLCAGTHPPSLPCVDIPEVSPI